jgi:hypothetical protein
VDVISVGQAWVSVYSGVGGRGIGDSRLCGSVEVGLLTDGFSCVCEYLTQTKNDLTLKANASKTVLPVMTVTVKSKDDLVVPRSVRRSEPCSNRSQNDAIFVGLKLH